MYTPAPTEEGFAVLKGALREYLAADLSAQGLSSVIELLPEGRKSIIDEGALVETTKTPVVMFSTVGDGQSELNGANSLVRFILYVIDRGRGLSQIERILSRMRTRLNSSDLALEALTFPPSVSIRVEGCEARGTTASTSLPAWKAEARGIYLFLTAKGLEPDY